MRVIAPYTRMHPQTVETLEAHGGPYEAVDVSSDDEAYWRLLAELWAAGEDFALIEHDMLLNGGEIDAFGCCPYPWCVYAYEGKQPIWTGRSTIAPRGAVVFRCALGCTRFRAELMAAHPAAISHMRLHRWDRLDSQLASFLFQRGEKACEHEPHVIHLHDYAAERVKGR